MVMNSLSFVTGVSPIKIQTSLCSQLGLQNLTKDSKSRIVGACATSAEGADKLGRGATRFVEFWGKTNFYHPRSSNSSEFNFREPLQRSCFILEGEVKATNEISEEELEEAFLDDPEFGLRLLHTDFRDRIAREIRSKLWDVRPNDARAEAIKDVYCNTILELAKLVHKGGYDWRKPLGIAIDIARKKAIDFIRRRRRLHKQDIEGAIDQIASDLTDTKVGFQWHLRTKIEKDEFHRVLLEAIDTVLTDKQAIIAVCFKDNFEEFGEREIYAPLARYVSEVTGKDENAMTIKKQWSEARQRLTRELVRRGFSFLDTEE